jgi:hypothetical protein
VKRRRHAPEQIVRKLREAERLLGEGKTIAGDQRADVSSLVGAVWRDEVPMT